MGSKDVQTKKYMRNPQIFADFFNGYLYEGEEVIHWENLEDVDSAGLAIVPTGNGKKRNLQKFRDILKQSVIKRNDEAYYVILQFLFHLQFLFPILVNHVWHFCYHIQKYLQPILYVC